jgi:hypothetical protein
MILEGEKKDWLKSLFLECSKQSIKESIGHQDKCLMHN